MPAQSASLPNAGRVVAAGAWLVQRSDRLLRRLPALLLAVSTLLAAPAAWAADALLVAAGAGYRKPVQALAEAFKAETGITVRTAFGHMKQIETQARQNPDVQILIGDRAFLEPMKLIETWQRLGLGELVLVTRRDLSLTGIDDLRDGRFGRIALPSRSRAVYGRAADICMQRSGLAAALASRLLEVDTVPQVSSYLVNGEVDAGFINRTEALAIKDRTGAQVTLPQNCHEPIELSLGVVEGRGQSAPVRRFVAFVAGERARAILVEHGL